jgi:hypothetical protein
MLGSSFRFVCKEPHFFFALYYEDACSTVSPRPQQSGISVSFLPQVGDVAQMAIIHKNM